MQATGVGNATIYNVSTLLEILAKKNVDRDIYELLEAIVSTLLEILGLMWLVFVGF